MPACSGAMEPDEEPGTTASFAQRLAAAADGSKAATTTARQPRASPDAAASVTLRQAAPANPAGEAAGEAAGPEAGSEAAAGGSSRSVGTPSTSGSPVLTPEKERASKAQKAAKQLLQSGRRAKKGGSKKRWSPSVKVPAPAYVPNQDSGADAGCSITARSNGSAASKVSEHGQCLFWILLLYSYRCHACMTSDCTFRGKWCMHAEACSASMAQQPCCMQSHTCQDAEA